MFRITIIVHKLTLKVKQRNIKNIASFLEEVNATTEIPKQGCKIRLNKKVSQSPQ
jgi:hypothetical protein